MQKKWPNLAVYAGMCVFWSTWAGIWSGKLKEEKKRPGKRRF